jgi:hypothetical protein
MPRDLAMKAVEARDLGRRAAELAESGRLESAAGLLAPVLAGRTPFRLLDAIGGQLGCRIGCRIGCLSANCIDPLLERLAADRTMGGWVVIAAALASRLLIDLPGAVEKSARYIEEADVWYAADSLAERVPGAALVLDFEEVLACLKPWRTDPNRWVRRSVGTAIHYWTKRSRGQPHYSEQVHSLLAFLAPMLPETDLDAAKGIGWGLKTLGRYYPDLLVEWLRGEIPKPQRPVVMRKALTYLSAEARGRVVGEGR